MKSQRKNEQIIIDENELAILSLIKEGMLGNCQHLMDEEEKEEVIKTSKFKNKFFPYPLTFAPKNNNKNIKNLKNEKEVDLICNEKEVGKIKIKNIFKNDKDSYIFNPNTCSLESTTKYCISGDIEILDSKIKILKKQFEEKKEKLNAKKITGIVSSFDPLHRAHERIFRWSIDKADLVVIFLIESYEKNGLDFDLKKSCLEIFINKYIPLDRIFIFPLKNVDIFGAHLNPGLEGIIAKSLGCTKLVVGQNHPGLGMFYVHNQPKTILDEFSKNYGIEVVILPEFVFCNKCKIIVSTRSCPHGSHHHMHYNTSSLKKLLRLGIIPPSVFMRKEISSIILSELFPNRFKNMQKIYNDLFPNDGLLKYREDNEFYEKLLEVYQATYMV